MAFSRKMFKAMGVEDEKIDEIIEAHMEIVDALKADVTKYKHDAEKLPTVQKELDELKAKGDDGWKEKHDKIKADFEKYKSDITAKETANNIKNAVRKYLKDEIGVSENHLEAVLRVYNTDGIELDEDGKIKDADSRKSNDLKDWADFIPESDTKGATTPNPPSNTGGRKTKEEIMAIKDRTERRKEIAENMDLFEGEN